MNNANEQNVENKYSMQIDEMAIANNKSEEDVTMTINDDEEE